MALATMDRRLPVRVIIGLLASLYLLQTRQASAEDLKLPVPKQASSTLEVPKPVRAERLKGKASLPEKLKLGFALDLADTLIAGNWDAVGKVISHKDRVVSFRTEQGADGNFVYRLPDGLELRVSPNQQIWLKRELRLFEGSWGYTFWLRADGVLTVASGRVSGAKQMSVQIEKGLAFKQMDKKEKISEGEYGTTYRVPAILVVNGQPVPLSLNTQTQLEFQSHKYVAVLTYSSKFIPSEKHMGAAEGGGFRMEYVLAGQ